MMDERIDPQQQQLNENDPRGPGCGHPFPAGRGREMGDYSREPGVTDARHVLVQRGWPVI